MTPSEWLLGFASMADPVGSIADCADPCIFSYWNDHLIDYMTHVFFPIGMTN